MKWIVEMGLPIYDIFDAARGSRAPDYERWQNISETSSKVIMELIPRDVYIQKANQIFGKMLKEMGLLSKPFPFGR